jgi:hypothetical protein
VPPVFLKLRRNRASSRRTAFCGLHRFAEDGGLGFAVGNTKRQRRSGDGRQARVDQNGPGNFHDAGTALHVLFCFVLHQ